MKEELAAQKVARLKDAALGKAQRVLEEIEEFKTVQATQAAESFLDGETLSSFCQGKMRQTQPRDLKEFK